MASPMPSNAENFYQMLLLLHTLDPIRGERAEPGTSYEDTRVDHASVRRSFIGAIAYICAYCRGPDYVTAAALQQKSRGITVWLAANAAIESKVPEFLKSVLHDLTEIARLERGRAVSQAESLGTNKLLPDIIAFETPKLQEYYGLIVKKFVPLCLKVMGAALAQGKS
jgi:hypothetical protein